MRVRRACLWIVAGVVGATLACSSSPSSPSGSGSVAAPRGVQPAPNSSIRNVDQPVTLSVTNAVVTETGNTRYTFEVATDANFTNRVQTKGDIAEGSGGQTSVRLDPLAPGTDYFWHVRATSAGTTGVFGAAYRFTVGPAVTINPPILVSPTGGAATDARPAFTVTNAPRTGPAGPITYRFEISTSAAFTPLAIDATIPEGAQQTTYRPTVDLPAEQTIYWRVTAIDQANGVRSPTTAAAAFLTSLAIDLSKVVYLNSPNVSTWPQTGTLELVIQDGNEALGGPMCTRFSDPGWPDSHWPFGSDPDFGVFANQWYFAKINGTWYGGAGEWIYRGAGTCKAGQGTTTIGPDSGFGPPFSTWVPRVGELVGFMISSVARNGPVQRTVDERTNVVVQPWRDTSRGSPLLTR